MVDDVLEMQAAFLLQVRGEAAAGEPLRALFDAWAAVLL
jgi:hypothetical protein